MESDRIKSCFDRILEKGYFQNETEGWMYLDQADNKDLHYFVSVCDSTGKEMLFPAEKYVREDICALKGNHKWYRRCGFRVNFPPALFREGELKFFAVIEENGIFYKGRNAAVNQYQEQVDKEKIWNIAFLGGIVPAKGSILARELIMRGKNLNWFIFGQIGDAELVKYEADNYYKMGPYNRDYIGYYLKAYRIDLVCILPQWAETFCYTLSEALESGIPVLVTDVGAVGERIRDTQCGWAVPVESDADEVLRKIQEIYNSPEDYSRKKENIRNSRMRDLDTMWEDYQSLYEQEYKPPACTIYSEAMCREMMEAFRCAEKWKERLD